MSSSPVAARGNPVKGGDTPTPASVENSARGQGAQGTQGAQSGRVLQSGHGAQSGHEGQSGSPGSSFMSRIRWPFGGSSGAQSAKDDGKNTQASNAASDEDSDQRQDASLPGMSSFPGISSLWAEPENDPESPSKQDGADQASQSKDVETGLASKLGLKSPSKRPTTDLKAADDGEKENEDDDPALLKLLPESASQVKAGVSSVLKNPILVNIVSLVFMIQTWCFVCELVGASLLIGRGVMSLGKCTAAAGTSIFAGGSLMTILLPTLLAPVIPLLRWFRTRAHTKHFIVSGVTLASVVASYVLTVGFFRRRCRSLIWACCPILAAVLLLPIAAYRNEGGNGGYLKWATYFFVRIAKSLVSF